jgi:hypothetical protein
MTLLLWLLIAVGLGWVCFKLIPVLSDIISSIWTETYNDEPETERDARAALRKRIAEHAASQRKPPMLGTTGRGIARVIDVIFGDLFNTHK